MRYSVSCKQTRDGIYQELSIKLKEIKVTINGKELRGDHALRDMLFAIKDDKTKREHYSALIGSVPDEKERISKLLSVANRGLSYVKGFRRNSPAISVPATSWLQAADKVGDNRNSLEACFGVKIGLVSPKYPHIGRDQFLETM